MAGHDAHVTDGRPPSGAFARRPEPPESVELHQAGGDGWDALRAEWDALADATGAAPFVRPGWVEPWHAAFGSGRLAVLAVRRDGRLSGALPLQRSRGALSSPTDWQTPLFAPIAADADAARDLARGLVAHAGRRADLWFLQPDAPATAECAAAAEEARFGLIVREIARMPFVAVEGSFEGYMAGLDRKFRKEIGRLWRRLEERGRVRVTYEDGTERLDDLLADGFRLEGSGWKAEAGTAIASDPAVERFYREVARWAAGRGWLRLAFLHLDDRALAFDMCIEHGGACYVLKGGFDVEARNLGPGTLLTHHEIERAFELGLSSYELLGQADDYKLRWTSTTHRRLRLQAFPPTPARLVEYLAWRRGRPLVKRLSGSSSSPSP